MAKKQLEGRACQFCGFTFIPKKSWQKFCNDKCHNKFWVARRVNPDDRFVKIEARLTALENK
jgi:ribosomal protein L24E